MEKKTYIGTTADGERVYITWNLENGNFSASGEYWNRLGDDVNSCGQNLDQIVEDFPKSEQAARIHKVWKEWHLNDMTAGSPIQEELIRTEIKPAFEAAKKAASDQASAYYKVRQELTAKLVKERYSTWQTPNILWDWLEAYISENKKFAVKSPGSVKVGQKGLEKYLQDGNFVFVSLSQAQIIRKGQAKFPDWYTFVCAELEKRGRLVDPDYIHRGRAYKYGSAWLTREIPQEVFDEINSWEDVEYECESILQILVREFECTAAPLGYGAWKLKVGKYSFGFTAGSAVKDVDSAMILGCVLQDAEYGQYGLDAAIDEVQDMGYEDVKEVLRVAKAVVKSYEKLEAIGLWARYQELMEVE